MTADDLQVRQVMWASSLFVAENLRMNRREEIDNLWEGQLVMIATPRGMNIGRIKVAHSETENSRHEKYHLNDELLYENTYAGTISDWGEYPTMVSHLPSDSVIYVEY